MKPHDKKKMINEENPDVLSNMAALQFKHKYDSNALKVIVNKEGIFGNKWCLDVKGDKTGKVLPSPEEVLIGLYCWICY